MITGFRRFDFEHKSALGALLVTVYSIDDFELWSLDLDVPVDFSALSSRDRHVVSQKICDRLEQTTGHSARELEPKDHAEISELNETRGVS